MKPEISTPQPVKSNTPAVTNTQEKTATTPESKNSGSDAERELAWALKSSINKNGRYAYDLGRYSLAFAAGKGGGTTEYQAKQEIEKIFIREVGVSPKQALEQYRKDRGLKIEPARSH